MTVHPAEPLLASHLLRDGDLDELLESCLSSGDNVARKSSIDSVNTGIKSVDDALGGGLTAGRLTGVCCGDSGGARVLCQTLLVTFLLRSPHATAVVIDTTGNFDVLGLYAMIVARINQDRGVLAVLPCIAEMESVERVAARVLDRVRIMRVFDFLGVKEAVDEVREELEGLGSKKGGEKGKHQAMRERGAMTKTTVKRTVVADSDEEDEDEHEHKHEHEDLPSRPSRPATLAFLLIDTIFPLPSPPPTALHPPSPTPTFLNALSNLTNTHALHTILVTPCSSPRSKLAESDGKIATQPQQHQQQQQKKPPLTIPPPSVFTTRTTIPFLMGVLARVVDVLVLVGGLGLEHGGGQGERGKKGETGSVYVVEVLGDRWSGLEGGWGIFRQWNEDGDGGSEMIGV